MFEVMTVKFTHWGAERVCIFKPWFLGSTFLTLYMVKWSVLFLGESSSEGNRKSMVWGLVVWIPGVLLWKGILLRSTDSIPKLPIQTTNLPLMIGRVTYANITRWWFQTPLYIFIPKIGEIIQFDGCILFKWVVQPPTKEGFRKKNILCWGRCHLTYLIKKD